MRIISSGQVRSLVTMADAVRALKAGYSAQRANPALCPPRIVLSPPGSHAYFGAMPAFGGPGGKFVVKVAALHLGGEEGRLSTMNAMVSVQDAASGRFEALIEGTSLTSLRTGATAGLVTDLLAPAGADTLAIIGSGSQALAQLQAMCAVRAIKTASIYSRNAGNVEAFIRRCAALPEIQCRLLAAPSIHAALDGAAIVCTATSSGVPIIEASDLAPGCHVNAVGNHTSSTIELAPSALEHAMLVVEEREAAVREAGEFNRRAHEIADLLAEPWRFAMQAQIAAPARAGHSVFVSVGTAFQDLCLATLVQQRAEQAQAGQLVTFD